MNNKRFFKKWSLLTNIGTSLIFYLLLFSLILFLPKGYQQLHLNNWDTEIDIETARVRQSHTLFDIKGRETIQETTLSRVLPADTLKKEPQWRSVKTETPAGRGGHYTTTYAYGHVLDQIKKVEEAWNLVDFSPAAKQHIVKSILHLWQTNKDDTPAGIYVDQIATLAQNAKNQSKHKITVEDLRQP